MSAASRKNSIKKLCATHTHTHIQGESVCYTNWYLFSLLFLFLARVSFVCSARYYFYSSIHVTHIDYYVECFFCFSSWAKWGRFCPYRRTHTFSSNFTNSSTYSTYMPIFYSFLTLFLLCWWIPATICANEYWKLPTTQYWSIIEKNGFDIEQMWVYNVHFFCLKSRTHSEFWNAFSICEWGRRIFDFLNCLSCCTLT